VTRFDLNLGKKNCGVSCKGWIVENWIYAPKAKRRLKKRNRHLKKRTSANPEGKPADKPVFVSTYAPREKKNKKGKRKRGKRPNRAETAKGNGKKPPKGPKKGPLTLNPRDFENQRTCEGYHRGGKKKKQVTKKRKSVKRGRPVGLQNKTKGHQSSLKNIWEVPGANQENQVF